jgi:hypothetical protein
MEITKLFTIRELKNTFSLGCLITPTEKKHEAILFLKIFLQYFS